MILTALTALLKVNGITNIFAVVIPQEIKPPHGKMFIVNDKPNSTKKEVSQINDIVVQVSVYADTYIEAETLAEAVKIVFDNYEGKTYGVDMSIDFNNGHDDFNVDTRLFENIKDYSILVKVATQTYSLTFIISADGVLLENAIVVVLGQIPKATNVNGEAIFTKLSPGDFSYIIIYENEIVNEGSTSILDDNVIVEIGIQLFPTESLIAMFKEEGFWDEIPFGYIFAETTKERALINFKGDPSFNAVETPNGGELILTVNQGLKGDGLASLMTNYNAFLEGLPQNSGLAISVWNNVKEDTWDCGAFDGSFHTLKAKTRANANEVRGFLNTSSQSEIPTNDARMHLDINRIDASKERYIIDTIDTIETIGGGNRGVSNAMVSVFGANNSGVVSAQCNHLIGYFIPHLYWDSERSKLFQTKMEEWFNEQGFNLWGNRDNYKVVENDFEGTPLGNTGLGYDESNDYLIISEFGDNVRSRLLIYDTDINLINTIDITTDIDYIQGNYLDPITGFYHVWGTQKGQSPTDGGKLISFNSLGVKQGEINIPIKYGRPSASINYAAPGEAWIAVPNDSIDRVRLSDGAILETRVIKVTEGFWINSDATVWASKNENFNLYDALDAPLFTYARAIPSVTEGLIVDKYGALWHNVDGGIHITPEQPENVTYKYVLIPFIP
jgi:hypothetical protein